MHGALATILNPTKFDVSQQDRHKQLDAFMKANPGKVKNMVGHSKGSAVIENSIRNNPDYKGQSRLYSTPYDDILGREKMKDWLNDGRKARAELVQGKPWIAKAANWVQDGEQDALEYVTGFDQVKGVKEREERLGQQTTETLLRFWTVPQTDTLTLTLGITSQEEDHITTTKGSLSAQ
jgi:hypothetical protein